MPEKFDSIKSANQSAEEHERPVDDFRGSPEDWSDSERAQMRGSESKKPGLDDYDSRGAADDPFNAYNELLGNQGEEGDERDLEVIRNRKGLVK